MVIVYVQIFVFNLRLEPILVSIALFYRSKFNISSSECISKRHFNTLEVWLVHDEFINQMKNKSDDGSIHIDRFSKGILIEDVDFKYANSKKGALNNISLHIPIKSSIAIVGESGAGKTTLVDLITLTNKPQNGRILIDNILSNELNKSTWRDKIGYVSQDTLIFDDTIGNNISMWKDVENSEIELREAAKKANILEFIQSLPDGFNTLVGDRGILLSGGQKQRIFIARELYRKPDILILDEATSSIRL